MSADKDKSMRCAEARRDARQCRRIKDLIRAAEEVAACLELRTPDYFDHRPNALVERSRGALDELRSVVDASR